MEAREPRTGPARVRRRLQVVTLDVRGQGAFRLAAGPHAANVSLKS
jgi:hypothetical protein